MNFRIGVKQGMYTRGIPEYDKLGVNQWMEAMRSGMQSYWEKDGGVTPQQAFEASKTVNDDIVFLLSLIRTVLPCSMKMESSYQR